MPTNENGARLARAYQDGAAIMPVPPVYLAIETTSRCNLACVMCPQPRMARAKRTMHPALFRRIVDQAAGAVEFAWLHLFGEPLLNRRFGDMARYAATHGGGMRTGVSTNVTLLTGARRAEVAALPLDIVLLSIDGIAAASYERIRVRGDFARVVDNVRAFAVLWTRRPPDERPRHVAISFIDLPVIEEETAAATAFWRGIVPPEFVLNRKPFHPWGYQDALIDDILQQVGSAAPRQRRNHGCHEFFRGMTILSDGRCVPCCNDYEARMVLGDVSRQTLAEIWNGARLQQLRRDRVLDNDLCRFCPQYSPRPEHALLEVSPFQPWAELQGYVTDVNIMTEGGNKSATSTG